MALEGTAASPEVIEPLMRAAHSLKGAARIVGLDAAVRVAHAMEDCFVAAQKGKLVLQAGHIDILLRGVDLLVQVAQLGECELEPWQSDHAGEIDTLVAGPDGGQGRVRHAVQPRAATAGASSVRIAEVVPSPLVRPWTFERQEEHLGRCPPQRPIAEQEPGGRRAGRPCERDREHDRVVRVTAGSLTRLMGLAGESLVQTHRLRPLVDSLWRLKARQTGLLETLQHLEDRLSSRQDALPAAERELSGQGPGSGRSELHRGWARRSRRWRSLPGAAKTFPAGCTMKC